MHGCCAGDLQHADLAARLTLTKTLTDTLNMPLRASDIVPISEARARLTELAEDVVGSGSEKVLTKNGASYVALVDARRLDYYHALEAEHANLVLAEDAIIGLREALAGQFVSDEELDQALGVASRP
jgi:PHD/YefM family antitoxin component YafN of YafNO toxin-antitoxin module